MNDMIRLAVDRACEDFGDPELFNAAGFACAIKDLSRTKGVLDGRVVRVLLTGRSDVMPETDGSHYRRIG